MAQDHLFLIDPLANLSLELDSSLRVMFEMTRRGHRTFIAEPKDLFWHSGKLGASASCKELRFLGKATSPSPQEETTRPLTAFSAIHMRKDPPYDLDYIATTWILDSVRGQVQLYNDSESLRNFNEKLAILQFPHETRPALVSASPEKILNFIETEADGDGIIKPLTLYGGRGVERVTLESGANGKNKTLTILKSLTLDGQSPRLVQAFDRAIFDGEVRAFAAFGQPISWCLKKPSPGNYLANTRAGASLSSYLPEADEASRVSRVAQSLYKKGVTFVGFDLIGGYISEINITSPRLLTGPDDSKNYYESIAALIEKDCRSWPKAHRP